MSYLDDLDPKEPNKSPLSASATTPRPWRKPRAFLVLALAAIGVGGCAVPVAGIPSAAPTQGSTTSNPTASVDDPDCGVRTYPFELAGNYGLEAVAVDNTTNNTLTVIASEPSSVADDQKDGVPAAVQKVNPDTQIFEWVRTSTAETWEEGGRRYSKTSPVTYKIGGKFAVTVSGSGGRSAGSSSQQFGLC